MPGVCQAGALLHQCVLHARVQNLQQHVDVNIFVLEASLLDGAHCVVICNFSLLAVRGKPCFVAANIWITLECVTRDEKGCDKQHI